jgi:hypothetical protein
VSGTVVQAKGWAAGIWFAPAVCGAGTRTTGEVSTHPEFGDFAFDPDTTNNTAVLAVN